MSTRIQTGRYTDDGEWQAFETVDVELDDEPQGKLAGQAKAELGTPQLSGATHVRVTVGGRTYEASYPDGHIVWDQ